MRHAILAARISRDAADHAVLVPVHVREQLGVSLVMTGAVRPGRVRHEITGRFPAADVAGRNRPGRTGQIAFAGEEFEIDRRAEECVAFHPLFHLREFLHRRGAGEEKIFRLQV